MESTDFDSTFSSALDDEPPIETVSCPTDSELADLSRDDKSVELEPLEKESAENVAGVDDPKNDCWPKLNGADELTKPSWGRFEPKKLAEFPDELYELIGLTVELNTLAGARVEL